MAEVSAGDDSLAEDQKEEPPRSSAEITYPVETRRSKTAAEPRLPPLSPLQVHVADDEDNSAELVDLIVERAPKRRSVYAGEILANRYRIVEKISHHGMGIVYKAVDRRRKNAGSPSPWVALKFAGSADHEPLPTSSYLRQEFVKLSQLNHPNIVSVFDLDHDGGLDFLVMEWLDGETLSSLLTRINSKRIAFGKAQEIIRRVAEGLEHAHERGIVHGDVKPSNIFLLKNRSVKLLDFGSSGMVSADGETEPNWATRAYASCEVLGGSSPQAHDDVFALGVTAYCLLSGERPFGNADATEARRSGLVPRPLPPDAQELWPAVAHALRLDAADRPAHASKFLLEFDNPPADTSEPAESNQLERIAYGAVAVVLLLALVAWTVSSVGRDASADARDTLNSAQTALAEGRLVEPSALGSVKNGESAYSLYSTVLESDPDNAEALEGLDRIVEVYLTRARDALAADDPDAASESLSVARRVMPDHFGVAVTADVISRYGKDLLTDARHALRTDPDRAESLLIRAANVLPPADGELAAVRQEIEKYRVNERLELLLSGIDQRILSERLTVPQGDSAVDLLRQARALAPEDRQVAVAADRIATALLFQSMFAVSNGNIEDAQKFIDSAKALNVRHLALARAQYELAKARHDAVRSGN
ncbi:MAG: serine/threonine-protein kinase [Woeseia sp.]